MPRVAIYSSKILNLVWKLQSNNPIKKILDKYFATNNVDIFGVII